jgi:hypothetical protein
MTTIKKKLIRPLSILFFVACLIMLNVVIASTADRLLDNSKKVKVCGSFEGHTLRKGPGKGGCYFIDKNNKTNYVDKRLCDC